MQEKKFKHKEIEICGLSKKKIDTLRDDYSIILDCRGEEIKNIKFYKTELLADLIKEKGEKVVKVLMQRTGNLTANILQKMGIIKKEYQI